MRPAILLVGALLGASSVACRDRPADLPPGAAAPPRSATSGQTEPVAVPGPALPAPPLGWRLVGTVATPALPASLAWRTDPETLWVLEAGGRRIHRLGAEGPPGAIPAETNLLAIAWDETRGALVGLDAAHHRLLVGLGAEGQQVALPRSTILGSLVSVHAAAGPSKVVALDALEHPVQGDLPKGYRGLPMADHTALRAAVTASGPVLLWSEPAGTFRRVALSAIPQATSLSVLGADAQGHAWLIATSGTIQPRVLPNRHLVHVDGEGRVLERAVPPPIWSTPTPPPGRPAAEVEAVVDRDGRIAWAAPGPADLQVWIYEPGGGPKGPRVEVVAPR